MKICLLVSSLGSGGAERVATTLCNAWARRGDRVSLIPTFSGGGRPFYEIAGAVELVYLADAVGIRKKSVSSYVQRARKLRALVRERAPDVVVSFLPNVNVAAILSFGLLRVPLIICERTDPSSFAYPPTLRMLCKWTYRFADMLTVQTESVASKVKYLYPGVRKVRCVPNPVPDVIFNDERRAENHPKRLLCLGRLSPEKQVDKLLRAFAEVAPRFGDWELHIYGDGPSKPALEKQIREAGLGARAILKGPTDNPWRVMAAADAFVMASRSEGFPNALAEAMAAGLPCIAFDCPSGPREITREGKDALLVPLNDHAALTSAFVTLMDDAALRASMGKQARESVCGRFGLPAVLARWDCLFGEVGAI